MMTPEEVDLLEQARQALATMEAVERERNENARKFLETFALETRTCSCGRTIYMFLNRKTNNLNPITEELKNHFADCPDRDNFRRNRGGQR